MERLKNVWIKHETELRLQYGDRESQNKGYTTVFTAVPTDKLYKLLNLSEYDCCRQYNYDTSNLHF